MESDHIKKSRSLHKNPNFSAPEFYSSKRYLKGRLQLPLAFGKTLESYRIKSFLDYGCGKGGLLRLLRSDDCFANVCFQGYDPAVEEFSKRPESLFDIVTCIDVLEHISRAEISRVLSDIDSLVKGFVFFAIDLAPAGKSLEDQRNAHILLAPPDWWSQQICSQFSYTRFSSVGQFDSGEKYPTHLFGWATNAVSAQRAANYFFDSIDILSSEWRLDDTNYQIVNFIKN